MCGQTIARCVNVVGNIGPLNSEAQLKKQSIIRGEQVKALRLLCDKNSKPEWVFYYVQGVMVALMWALSNDGISSPLKQLRWTWEGPIRAHNTRIKQGRKAAHAKRTS